MSVKTIEVGDVTILNADCRTALKSMPDNSVDCCVTSPPYFGLRSYGHDDQIGLEDTPEAYIQELVGVFSEVKRVLKPEATLWVNIGDSYASYRDGKATPDTTRGDSTGTLVPKGQAKNRMASTFRNSDIKHKDLIGVPWMLAFALRADGWGLRQDIIWQKNNPLPESVKDRCTKAHEYIFLLSKSPRYYFDYKAIQEASISPVQTRDRSKEGYNQCCPHIGDRFSAGERTYNEDGVRNKRSVWSVSTQAYKGAHFAVFPSELIRPCIKAGCPKGGVVLDPFAGSGTTGKVALEEGCRAVLIELNPDYVKLIEQRVRQDTLCLS